MPRFDVNSYVDVAERVQKFWEMYPDGRIFTNLDGHTDGYKRIVFFAAVYKHRDDPYPSATGYAFEDEGGSGANLTSHVENGETSAIGRALANLGLKTRVDEPRPSRQEMEKVNRKWSSSLPNGLPESNDGGQGPTGLSRIFRDSLS